MQSAVNPVANAARSFSSTTYALARIPAAGGCFKGSLDDIRIYNTSLTAGNVRLAAGVLICRRRLPTAAAATRPSPATWVHHDRALGPRAKRRQSRRRQPGLHLVHHRLAAAGRGELQAAPTARTRPRTTTATFTKPGNYSFLVTIADQGGLSTTSSVSVAVNLTSTSINVQSGPLAADGTVTFTAVANDQFGNPMSSQPQFTWTLAGGGALSASGVFTPPYNTGSATITASSGTLSGNEIIALPGAAQLNSSGTVSWNGAGVWKSSSTSTVVAAPGIRGVTGDLATFATVTGGSVNLNGASPILAGITFADSGTYSVGPGTGGTLHLGNAAATATVTVAAAGAQTISAPLALDSNVAISAASREASLTISGFVSGNGHSLSVSWPRERHRERARQQQALPPLQRWHRAR